MDPGRFDPLRLLEGSFRREHALIFFIAVVPRTSLWFSVGTRMVRDANRYVTWCGDLSVGTLVGSRALAYVGYWLPYCGWLRPTDGFLDGWIAVQIGLSALACVFVYDTARRLVDNRAGLVAGGLLAVQWEVYKWVVRPQSEFLLTVAVALAVWRLTIQYQQPTRRNRVVALASLGFVALVRPNGLPIVGGYLLYDLLPRTVGHRLDLFLSPRRNLLLVGTLAALVGYRLSFGWARGSVLWPWKDGIVVTPDRVVYEYSPTLTGDAVTFFIQNLDHVITIAILRGVWFFAPVMPGWSAWHALTTGITLTPLTIGAGLGIYRAARHDRSLLQLWGTPLLMIVLTAMLIWVAGWRNFLGPAAVVYALFSGYYLSEADWVDWAIPDHGHPLGSLS